MRITVAHEWLTNWAGSERVAEQLADVTGARELVASVVDGRLSTERFPDLAVRPLWVSRLPAATTRWSRYALPMIGAWATARIEADALVVSSHFAAHAAAMRFAGPSIVYYHTPARMLWRPEIELARLPPAVRAVVREAVLPPLRRWDRYVARFPTVVLANSTAVAARIRDAYGRRATVLHPPVDVDRWAGVERRRGTHVLWLGRLVAYKRPDIAVEAARRCGLPLLVVGDGPERARLEPTAPPHVRFLGHLSDAGVRDALAHARMLVFPGEEDFGIAPVEALAAGVPVVARAAGGALDYVSPGENGLLVDATEPDDFAAALRRAWAGEWDVGAVRRSALPFSTEQFRRGFADVLDATLGSAWRARRAGAVRDPDRLSGGRYSRPGSV